MSKIPYKPGTLLIGGYIHDPDTFAQLLSRDFDFPGWHHITLHPDKPSLILYPDTPFLPDVDQITETVVKAGGGIAWAWNLDKHDTTPGIDFVWNENNHIHDARFFDITRGDKNGQNFSRFLKSPLILKSAHYTLNILRRS